MKILICPNSFKESISSIKSTSCICKAIKSIDRNYIIKKLPLSDGGEGFINVISHYIKGKKVYYSQLNSYLLLTKQYFFIANDSVFIESAQAIGYKEPMQKDLSILKRSSYPLGNLILQSLDYKPKNVYISIGGTATNDGGFGALKALGIRFYDKNNKELQEYPKNLEKIVSFDYSKLDSRLSKIKFTLISDCSNLLLGKNGATCTYGKQKGANSKRILNKLENGLTNFKQIYEKTLKTNITSIIGGGAGGGIIAFMQPFLHADVILGSEYISNLVNLENEIKNTDLIISGEGKIDKSSFEGKQLTKVLELSTKYKKPLYLICGSISNEYQQFLENKNVTTISLLSLANNDIVDCMSNPQKYIRKAVSLIIKTLK